MPAYTPLLGLYKPGGGSTGDITPDEPVDVDKLNANFDLLDAAIGFGKWTTASRPAKPYKGQTGYNSTLDLLERWDGSTWGNITPSYLQAGSLSTQYFTQQQLTGGALDSRYYTQTALLNGALDSRYSLKAASTAASTTGTVVSGWTLNRFAVWKINHIVHVDLSVTRTGGSIGPSSSGNITNIKVGNVGAWHPVTTWAGLAPGPGGAVTSCAVDSNGDLWLCALPVNFTMVNGNELTAGGSWYTAS